MAYLEITLAMEKARRVEAATVYDRYKRSFLDGIPGTLSKELLVRDEDVQVLHGFSSAEQAGDPPPLGDACPQYGAVYY